MPRAALTSQLQAFLLSGTPYQRMGLYKVALTNGTTYLWNDSDYDMSLSDGLYSCIGPMINKSSWSVKNTVDIPEMDLKLFSTGYDLPGGANILLQIHNGLLAGAYITYSILYQKYKYDNTFAPMPIFAGNVSKITISNTVDITVKGLDHQFAQYIPKNLFSNRCMWSLYGAGCAPVGGTGPSRAAHTHSFTVGTGANVIYVDWGTPPSDWANYSLGTITFTSGAAAGTTRSISQATAQGCILSYPLYENPATGDAFTATHGCDHSKNANGCAFFNNLANFRGFPFIPPAQSGLV
jgi:hypothetical protein